MKIPEWKPISVKLEEEFDKNNKSRLMQSIKEKMEKENKQLYAMKTIPKYSVPGYDENKKKQLTKLI